MKIPLLLAAIALSAAALTAAETPALDADWQAYQAKLKPTFTPGSMKSLKPGERLVLQDKWLQEADAASLDYYRRHPTDPRRWEAANRFIHAAPKFVTAVKPGYDSKPSTELMIVDEAARMEYDKTVLAVQTAMDGATDIPDTIPQAAEAHTLTAQIIELSENSKPADLEALKAQIVGQGSTYRDVPAVAKLVEDFVSVVVGSKLASAREAWGWFADSPNPDVAKEARESLASTEDSKDRMDIAFTAVDGRKVDTKDLRGKVVLVDFWATWCGPCVAELPQVIAAYKKYHDQGFEVIGITVEDGRIRSDDPPDLSAQKLQRAVKVLNAFTAKNDMPWPQYCDGKGWEGTLIGRFSVTGIPQTYLLDKNGRVVSKNPRGDELEAAVKHLLSL